MTAAQAQCFATSAPLLAVCQTLLADATGAPPSVMAFRLESVAEALARGQRCVIVWQSPRAALAQALDAGDSPGAAVSRWQQTARDVLELHRRNRRNLTLVADKALTDPDQDCVDLLRERLGWVRAKAPRPLADDSELAALLADLAIRQLPDLARLLDLLAASSISPPAESGDPAWLERSAAAVLAQKEHARAAQTYSELSAGVPERKSLVARLTEREAEMAALQSQLAAQEAALAAARTEVAQAQADAARQETELQAARQAAEALARADAAARAEIDLLRGQLALEKQALADWIKSEAVVEQLEAEAADLRAQLADTQGFLRATRQDCDAARADATAGQTGLLAAEREIARLTQVAVVTAEDILLMQEQLALQLREMERMLVLDARLQDLDRQLVLQLAAVAQADQTISALQAENEAIGSAGRTAAHGLAALQTECDALKGEIAELRRFKAEAEHLADALISTQGLLGAQSAEAEVLRQQATALLNSTSWRMTAPLRGVSTLLGRRRS